MNFQKYHTGTFANLLRPMYVHRYVVHSTTLSTLKEESIDRLPGTPGFGRRQGRREWRPPAAAGNSEPESHPGPVLGNSLG